MYVQYNNSCNKTEVTQKSVVITRQENDSFKLFIASFHCGYNQDQLIAGTAQISSGAC